MNNLTTHCIFFVLVPLTMVPSSGHSLEFTSVPGISVGINIYYESNPPYGGGVAVEDFDGDGDIDLIFTGGLFGKTIQYFRNVGVWQWVEATQDAGLGEDFGMEKGIAVADYDNDGDLDFYVAVWDQGIGVTPKWVTGMGVLYANDGKGHFTKVDSGIQPNLYSSTGAWGDFDRDGDLDLYVSNYFASPNNLFRNDDGFFVDVGNQAGVAATPGKGGQSFQATWIDLDFDGYLDLHVTNDRCYAGFSPNYFFSNQGNGTFVEKGSAWGLNTCMDSMGAAFADYNRDGFFDVYIANTPKGHSFKVQGCGGFVESAKSTVSFSEGTTGWGILFEDFDYDGWDDIYVAHAGHGVNYYQNKMFRNLGNGTFEDISAKAGVQGGLYNATGVARADLDGDGDLDIIIVNVNDGPVEFLRNDGPTGNYLRIKLVGSVSNRDGQGAVVDLVTAGGRQRKGLFSSNEYLSTGQRQVFFGLGTESFAEAVVVRWPMGTVQTLHDVTANQVLTIVEAAAGDVTASGNTEICGDGIDNDCDGVVDNGFGVNETCVVGIGACAAPGHIECGSVGYTSYCKADIGLAGVELCGDGIDNDCDGETDEGFNVGEPCLVGVGGCENTGQLSCNDDGSETVCNVEPLPTGPELCGDLIDNDCDGLTDEGFSSVGETCGNKGMTECSADKLTTICIGEEAQVPDPVEDPERRREDPDPRTPPLTDPETPTEGPPSPWNCGVTATGKRSGDKCIAGVGACAVVGEYMCTSVGTQPVCMGEPTLPTQERCGDYVDNDCDGYIDEGFLVGQPCVTGVGACLTTGVRQCSVDGLNWVCAAQSLPSSEELCGDGVDNDCDGEIDEGFFVGAPCILGEAPCAAVGTLICAPNSVSTVCMGAPPNCEQSAPDVSGIEIANSRNAPVDGCESRGSQQSRTWAPLFLLVVYTVLNKRRKRLC